MATLAIAIAKREAPWPALREVSWSVLLLVAGLFVIVGALAQAGALALLTALMRSAVHGSEPGVGQAQSAGIAVGVENSNALAVGGEGLDDLVRVAEFVRKKFRLLRNSRRLTGDDLLTQRDHSLPRWYNEHHWLAELLVPLVGCAT